MLGFLLPQVLGGGNRLVDQLAITSYPLAFLLLLLAAKYIFTLISYGCGVPGGFFLPLLVIGALTGAVLANLLVSAGLLSAASPVSVIRFPMICTFAEAFCASAACWVAPFVILATVVCIALMPV